MVDRPHPVDAAWLEQITTLYGEYQLVAMTRTGERGIATLMYVALGSLRFLRPAPASMAAPFTAALRPLLDELPAPILKLRWDVQRRLWLSEFWMGLPPVLQTVFRKTGYGCLAGRVRDRALW